ncbi:hypothetical protein JCM11251_006992 [Rhodosporidiobolus azoricus]
MEAQQVYHFTEPSQFWAELEDLIAVPPDATLDELDYALRNYIAFASTFMDEFLAAPGALNHALIALLSAPLFTSHVDRMIQSIISSITSPLASSSSLFISLMLVLHLGENDNPLTLSGSSGSHRLPPSSSARHHRQAGAGVTVGSSKVFRLMRRRWKEVVPVLMKWVTDAEVVEEAPLVEAAQEGEEGGEGEEGDTATAETPVQKKKIGMPAEGWEERVGTAATSVLYELCRVQKLTAEELADFNFDFVSHLFTLVERTRDVEDETFNYSLIKLIIALNEQFMVASSSATSSTSSTSSTPSHVTSHTNPNVSSNGGGNLPPPILPTVAKGAKRERGPNLVLEVLKEQEHESKTFGENIIFILNRADGTPDSLCVSLLILKILYLLFTTSGTQEFFYTNDLCVLVDVFIRELCDLGEESEGLKHTYLRVLHPLLTNTQLRTYPYKRPQLRRVLEQLIAPSSYRDCDPTTRRLVERNLRGSWCQGLRNQEMNGGAFIAGVGGSGLGDGQGSTLSVDAIATADDGKRAARKLRHQQKGGHHGHHSPSSHHRHPSHRRMVRRQSSLDDSSSSTLSCVSTAASSASTAATSAYVSSPLSSVANGHATVNPVAERNLRGEVPSAVRASHALATASSSADTLTASPRELAPSPLPEGYDGHSVPSIEAGHDLLSPIAGRHLTGGSSAARAVSATHPSPQSCSASLAPPLVHPRPRSTSLSAASYRANTHGLGLTDSPPPPLPPPSPSPSASSASTIADYHSSSTSSGAAPKQRRRPPPPPTCGPVPYPDITGGASLSRPRTPSLAPPPVDSVPSSPRVGTRRRPPPPPSAGGGGKGSPKQGRNGPELEGVMEGLRLAYQASSAV